MVIETLIYLRSFFSMTPGKDGDSAVKKFNTTGICNPDKHYMVDISKRLEKIKTLINDGDYFCINRARQYGKTTTLAALNKMLINSFIVINLDFQGIGQSGFETEEKFVQELSRLIWNRRKIDKGLSCELLDILNEWKNAEKPTVRLGQLFDLLFDWCEHCESAIVLIIDEVDSATNNQVFLDFLAQLRDGYLSRERDGIKTFQSVILAGVTDVKHLKTKIRPEDVHKENSPWNIATDFTIDMSLSEEGIRSMLDEYEADHHSEMDTGAIARLIREYTNGYPFLVSRICQLIDENISKKNPDHDVWTRQGVEGAVKLILAENNTLFQSLTKNLNMFPEMKEAIRSILMEGTKLAWNPDQNDIVQMQMYGLIRNDNNTVRISNRIFEMRLYNLFLSDEELKNNVFFRAGDLARNQFVEDGKLNMRLILERFCETYTEIYGPLTDRFKEKDGRELFLLYLKPIINGTGHYYIEAQTRDQTRTDVIVDYLAQQYIVELKIWRGQRYNEDGEKQILEYLDYFGLTTGYMLSFNFNKHKNPGVKRVSINDKILYEATV